MTANQAKGSDLTKPELAIIYLVAAVQFVNIVDFMMVMPLGPDFAQALDIKVSHLGMIAGTYTFAAAVSGIISSTFIDQYDRKTALFWSVIGLSVGTVGAAISWNLSSLLWARALAGAFGGPATSIGLAIIADVVPPARRGRALGAVMMAFSLASTFGVPLGLELARMGTWHTPFVVVGAAGLLAAFLIRYKMPTMQEHLLSASRFSKWEIIRSLLGRKVVIVSYAMTCFLMMSGFFIFPNLAAYVQLNLHVPRSQLSQLYLAGGIVTLATMRMTGRWIDQHGAVPWFLVGSVGFLGALVFGFLSDPVATPWLIFGGFMFFGTFRNMSANTLASKVPSAHERAGFMSVQSAVQHFSTALAGYLSTKLLFERPDGSLGGTELVAYASMGFVVAAAVAIVILNALVKKTASVSAEAVVTAASET